MLSSLLPKALLRHARALLSALIFLIAAPVALHATPITYDLTLTETDGVGNTYSGTGQVTLDITGTPQNGVNYVPTALQFTVDGQTFNMSDPTQEDNVWLQFSDIANGGISDITFAETNSNGYRIATTGGYIFYTPGDQPVSPGWTGTFSASPASSVAATPEPGSFLLLGTGLFAGAGGLFRRYKFQRS